MRSARGNRLRKKRGRDRRGRSWQTKLHSDVIKRRPSAKSMNGSRKNVGKPSRKRQGASRRKLSRKKKKKRDKSASKNNKSSKNLLRNELKGKLNKS